MRNGKTSRDIREPTEIRKESKLEKIIEGVLKFQREIYPRQKALFDSLANSQSPRALFIGCSDSRVVPEWFSQQVPGDLFVIRNAGNIVPPHGIAPGGVSASVEYAVGVLGVPDIILCGHSGCGAMTALQREGKGLEKLPAIAKWLTFAEPAYLRTKAQLGTIETANSLDALIQQNVLLQLENLRTHPSVAEAIGDKKLRLHGWVFDIASGGVKTYDAQSGTFVALNESASNDESVSKR
jgi:carbonic anhydrase